MKPNLLKRDAQFMPNIVVEEVAAPLYDSLESFGAALSALGNMSAEYADKMVHKFSLKPNVHREEWLLKRCEGRVVLHVGASGPFDAALRSVAQRCYGIDMHPQPQRSDFVQCDLDHMTMPLPHWEDVDIVLVPEILEHLMAPGLLLERLHTAYPEREIVLTTPNAFCPQGRLSGGVIMVNQDHTMWFCPQTLGVLCAKAGLRVQEWMWYGNPSPPFSEGIIFVAR